MLKKLFLNFWPQTLITLVILVFFGRLFFPPSIFVTPDFGRSDILHISLPHKYILSQNLKNFKIPLWEPNAKQGYPLNAELVDAYFIPNLLVFFAVPFKWAIPTIYLITFLTSAFGMYLLTIRLKLGRFPAVIAALSFTFSAAMILRIAHTNITQAISVLPWAFFFFLNFLTKPNLKNATITTLALSQILLSFAQIFVYALTLFFIIGLSYVLFVKKRNIKVYAVYFSLIVIFTLTLSAIQIIPTLELVRQSQRNEGVNSASILNDFPLNPKNLASFINPFILGKAANGTYNSTDWAKNGIYWESTAYIGFLPFLFAIFAICYLVVKRPKNIFSIIALTAIFSLLLALGKFAPTHVIFSIPPLNYFRVPARFIMFTQFFLAILAGYGINKLGNILPKKTLLVAFVLIGTVTIIDLYSRWWSYNPIGRTDEWLKEPEVAASLNRDNLKKYRVFTIGSFAYWNDIFVKEGWQGKTDYYKFFLNEINPDLNFFFQINHLSSYQILPTRRQIFLDSVISAPETFNAKGSVQLNETAIKALNLFGVKYVISTIPLTNNSFHQIFETEKDKYKFLVYENDHPQELINIYYNYDTVKTLADYQKKFKDVDLEKTVLLENQLNKTLKPGEGSIEINEKNSTRLLVSVKTTSDGILVFSDSYYPGWEAKIDSKPTRIYPANINSKAIVIPTGEHKVEFIYRPKSFLVGSIITIISVVLALIVLFRKTITFQPK